MQVDDEPALKGAGSQKWRHPHQQVDQDRGRRCDCSARPVLPDVPQVTTDGSVVRCVSIDGKIEVEKG